MAGVSRASSPCFWAIGSLLVALEAQADPVESFRLSLVRGDGAESCPNTQELADRVQARLGRDPFSDPADREIEASVHRAEDAWQARIRVRTSDGLVVGSRDLGATGADCSLIADAVVLAVALTIDPQAALAPLPEVAALAEKPPPAPESTPAPVPPSAPEPERCPTCLAPPRGGVSLGAHGVVSAGLLPGAAFGADLSGLVSFSEHFHAAAGVLFLPESPTSDGAFAFGLTAFTAGLCADARLAGHLALGACGKMQLGAIHSVVFAPAEPTDPGERWWAALEAGPVLRFSALDPLALEIGASAVTPLVRYEFQVENRPGTIFQSLQVGLLAFAGGSLSIP